MCDRLGTGNRDTHRPNKKQRALEYLNEYLEDIFHLGNNVLMIFEIIVSAEDARGHKFALSEK